MPTYVALLRAVNVGGTGKLPMSDLVAIAKAAGFGNVRTYIASGNLMLESSGTEQEVKTALEDALSRHTGKRVTVMVRTADEVAAVLAANPFPDKAPNRTLVVLLDAPPPADCLESMVAPGGEEVRVGVRELYIHYGEGMAQSKLKLPAASSGTARNINTVARLVAMTRP